MTGMEALIASAAIQSGAQLLGGLFGQKAAREQEEENRKLQAAQTSLGLEQSMLTGQQQATGSAFGNLISAYRSGLGG